MPCYYPIPAFQGEAGGVVRLNPPVGTATMQVPCGACLGCRTDRATQWARRCEHEAKLWAFNSFVTLTYDDAHVPRDGWLEPLALQLFLKRLRRAAEYRCDILRDTSSGIRFFACGEYGEINARPHYHLLLFNCDFADRVCCGRDIDSSEIVRELWPFGQNVLGKVSGASAAYVAQYSLKKQGGRDCDADGVYRPRPFLRMSLRPGIGAGWLEQYAGDLRGGYLVAHGSRGTVPRAYRRRLEVLDPALAEIVRENAYQRGLKGRSDRGTPARLEAAEVIHRARKAMLDHPKL